jgi:heptosyltransferase-2
MKDATMNYVNDSAPMHLASAMNAPVTAIFCSTVPAFGFGPLSNKSVVIESKEKLTCRPCGLHGYRACPQKHFKCATTIESDALLASLQ